MTKTKNIEFYAHVKEAIDKYANFSIQRMYEESRSGVLRSCASHGRYQWTMTREITIGRLIFVLQDVQWNVHRE